MKVVSAQCSPMLDMGNLLNSRLQIMNGLKVVVADVGGLS